jgi:hypothetical protein
MHTRKYFLIIMLKQAAANDEALSLQGDKCEDGGLLV